MECLECTKPYYINKTSSGVLLKWKKIDLTQITESREAESKMRKWLLVSVTTVLFNSCLVIVFMLGNANNTKYLAIPVRSLQELDLVNDGDGTPKAPSEDRNTTASKHFSNEKPTTLGYSRTVIAVRVSEQMTMAMSHVYQLARFATEWQARLVLPFVKRDMLKALPDSETKSLDLLYDLSKLDEISAKHGILPFMDFESFLKKSSRENIYFFRIYYFGQGGEGPVVEPCNEPEELKLSNLSVAALNRVARTRSLPGFKSSNTKCCKVRSTKPTVPEDFLAGCGMEGVQNFTILVSYWRGYTGMPTKRFRMFVPKYHNKFNLPQFNLPYSKIVENTTIQFVDRLTNGKKFIGVHIRAQKLLIRHKDSAAFDDKKCIRNLSKLVEQVSRDQPDTQLVIYIADGFIKKYKELLAELSINISQFDPLLFNSIENDAFIAQVEQNTLSFSTVLITCGGGSFEESISLRFKERNPKGTEHNLCY